MPALVLSTSLRSTPLRSGLGAYTPSLLLDFTSNQMLDPRITFTRSSTATYYDQLGVLSTAAIDAPRFDYNPTTLAPLGLLIEEQQTNLLTYSEQFNAAAWTKSRVTITADAIVSPDGTMDADKMTDDTGTGSHTVRNATSVTITSGTTLTASVFAKAAEGAYVIVGIGDGGGSNISRATFNLSTKEITNLTTPAANVSAPIPVITSVGNGWYRCTVTATVTGVTAAQQWIFKGANSNGSATYTGDGTSGIYIYGAQLEAGAFATSYIPTVASQVTRAADAAVMTGTNFSSWYNATEGTLLVEFAWEGLRSVAGQRIMILDDGTNTTYWGLLATGGNGMQNPVVISGTTEATNSTPSTVYTASTPYKQAVALALNNSVGAINRTAGTTDTTVGVPSGLTTARFAATSTGTVSNIWFRKIAYYPRRLTNNELQGITS